MKKLLILSILVVVSANVCEGSDSLPPPRDPDYLLVDACKRRDVALVKSYILDDNGNPDAQDNMENTGPTLLCIACQNNDERMVKTLIEECHANIDKENKIGNTPLIIATYHKHVEIVKYLLEQGANINKKGEGEKTALSIAETFSENGYDTEAKRLLQCLINGGVSESSDLDSPNEKELSNR